MQIAVYRKTNNNLRTQLERIIKRAGLQPWPRTFQNLRSSRETERAESYPLHVVTAWIGNSKATAAKHYLQIRDEDFDQATRTPTKAAQNPAQSGAESSRKGVQTTHRVDHAIAVFLVKTADCEVMQVLANKRDGDEGNRTILDSTSRKPILGNLPKGGAQSGAHDAAQPPKDPDLTFIQHHWHELNPETRQAITQMVRASVRLQNKDARP